MGSSALAGAASSVCPRVPHLEGVCFRLEPETAGVSPWLVGTTSASGTLPTEADFQGRVGQWFYVAGSSSVPMQLMAVVDGPTSIEASQFTLFFSAPTGAIEEGTFTVTPPTGDPFDLFLQPTTGEGNAALTLRASFNLLQPAPVVPSCA